MKNSISSWSSWNEWYSKNVVFFFLWVSRLGTNVIKHIYSVISVSKIWFSSKNQINLFLNSKASNNKNPDIAHWRLYQGSRSSNNNNKTRSFRIDLQVLYRITTGWYIKFSLACFKLQIVWKWRNWGFCVWICFAWCPEWCWCASRQQKQGENKSIIIVRLLCIILHVEWLPQRFDVYNQL